MGNRRGIKADLSKVERYKNIFDQGFLNLSFITLVIITHLGGLLFTILLLGVSAYSIMKPPIHLPVEAVIPRFEIKIEKPEIPAFISNIFKREETPRDEEVMNTREAVSTSTPTEPYSDSKTEDESSFPAEVPPFPTFVSPTHEPTATLTPTVVVSSLEYAPEALCSPIEGIEMYELQSIISQEYNVPNQFSDSGHHGVDFGSYNFREQYLFGIYIKAMLAGKVAGVVNNRFPLGNAIILETTYEELPESLREIIDIEPGQSLYHLYGHLMDDPDIVIGTRFNCGDPINRLGASQTAEAHLHLETRVGRSGLVTDSMAFYDTSATEEEQEEYLWWRTSGDLVPFDPMDIFLNFRYQ